MPTQRPQSRVDHIIAAIAVLAAIALLFFGFRWLNGIQVEWDWQETAGRAVIILGALGIVVGIVIARFWRIPGLIISVLALTGAIVGLSIGVDEIRLDTYAESDRRPVAPADAVPVAVTFDPVEAAPLADPDLTIADLDLEVELVKDGFEQPVAVAPIPGTDDLFVAERTGKIFRLSADGDVDDTPVLNLTGETDIDGERGVYDIAFSPAGDRLYVSFSGENGDNQVSSWAWSGDMLDLAGRLDVITVEQPYETHNGGAIAFGPDGYLYIGIGDGGRLRDPLDVGQKKSTRLGSILRILPDEENGDYLIPPTNPYLDEDDTWPEIFVYGSRNPWQITFDSATGDMWVGDVGQSEYEEVHFLPAGDESGANFGWRRMVADEIYAGADFDPTGYTEADRPDDHVPPVFVYAHDPEAPLGARASISGGYVYRGDAIPELQGTYLYGDWSGGFVGAVVFDEDINAVEDAHLDVDVPVPVAFAEDADGEVLVISIAGGIYRIVSGAQSS